MFIIDKIAVFAIEMGMGLRLQLFSLTSVVGKRKRILKLNERWGNILMIVLSLVLVRIGCICYPHGYCTHIKEVILRNCLETQSD